MPVQGTAAPSFAAVREEFERNFADRGDLGAGLSVVHRGQVVVDLWGGWVDEARTVPWRSDTVVHTYSTIKPLVAACALLLVDRGALALDVPVARQWPEFAAAGKEEVTVRQLLSHQAGLVALREAVPASEIFDWDAMVERLAAEAPWWPPGTGVGEHAYFYGHLVGELVRRVDGRDIRRFFREELAGPWGLDIQIGVVPEDRTRVAPLVGLESLYPAGQSGEPGSIQQVAVTNPPGMLLPEVVNSDAWMSAAVPAVNGFGTAAAVARFYQVFLAGGLLDGRRVLSESLCSEATTIQASGDDVYLQRQIDWGLGFQVENGSYGHGGLGGSSGYAEPRLELALGYVTNLMADHDRVDAVADAAEACAQAHLLPQTDGSTTT
jgi:CubicO group peptidase (beta-lactamase class C family)